MKKALVLYFPVVHKGYINLLVKYDHKIDTLFVLGNSIFKKLQPIHKEIRALDPQTVKKLLVGLKLNFDIKVLNQNSLKLLENFKIILVNDSISKRFARKYIPYKKVVYESIFLRWDEKSVISNNPPSYDKISTSKFDRTIMSKASSTGQKSSDWWRQVGAVLVKNKRVVSQSFNKHLPSEHTPYIEGDPRDFIKAGLYPELSSVIHSEQAIIAKAAKLGVSLKGSSIYVTTYPCPVCAKLIAESGIKKCYFASGNAYLNVERILKLAGVTTILVKP